MEHWLQRDDDALLYTPDRGPAAAPEARAPAGVDRHRPLWLPPLWRLELGGPQMSAVATQAMRAFFQAQQGTYGIFRLAELPALLRPPGLSRADGQRWMRFDLPALLIEERQPGVFAWRMPLSEVRV